MRDQDIVNIGPLVRDITEDNAVLFLWTTEPKQFDDDIWYEQAHKGAYGESSGWVESDSLYYATMKSWGFRPVTTAFVWVKMTKDGNAATGPGFYTASNIERVLIGVKGRMTPTRRMVNQVVFSERMRHSQKPEEVQNRIEEMYPNAKYLEMFARRERQGWTTIGNEICDGEDIRNSLVRLANE